jgi:hypothetical protein
MKNLIKEFFSSIYNPSFYKQINDKSLKSILSYMLSVDVIVSVATLIATAIYLALNLNQFGDISHSTLVVSYIMAILSAFITIFLTIFITWILYGWIFGIIILGVSTVFRNKIPYTVSVKTAFYAMSLGVILTAIPYFPLKLWLIIVVPILIVLINLKKK